MISAIVLSAGASFRMGSPKGLLTINEKTFLHHLVDEVTSAGIQDIMIVLGADADKIRKSLQWFQGRIVVNQNWKQGQLSSIITGLNQIPHDAEGVLICPVDHPLISRELINDLFQSFKKNLTKIILPVYQGRRGHPVIFPSVYFDELKNASLEVGARKVVRAHPNDIVEVATDENGVIINIDTQDDYNLYFPKSDS